MFVLAPGLRGQTWSSRRSCGAFGHPHHADKRDLTPKPPKKLPLIERQAHSSSAAESPLAPGETGLTPLAPLPYEGRGEPSSTHPPLPRERGNLLPNPAARREALGHTAAILAGAGGVVGIAFADRAVRDRAAATTAGVPMARFVPPLPRVPGFPVDGQLPEITPVPQFYVVSKNAQDPRPDPGTWRDRKSTRLNSSHSSVSRMPSSA